MHIHPNCLLSGLVYIKTPKNCGSTVFISPRQLSKNLEPTYLEKNEINSDAFTMPAEKGRMLIWPSYVPHDAGVPKAYGDWRALVEDGDVQAVAIATLPSLQVPIAIRALELGKPVFAEKPMANDLAGARTMLRQATLSRKPTIVDFNFHQIVSWQRAKAMLATGAIGALRHVTVHWHVAPGNPDRTDPTPGAPAALLDRVCADAD